jgi:hypothetical protein
MPPLPENELKQLKTGLVSLVALLQAGVDHLDTLTARTIARTLAELMQEFSVLAPTATEGEIAQLVSDVLVGTTEMQAEMMAKWHDELRPLMERSRERAEALDHDLADFTCLSVDGQQWGAICVRCMEWVFVQPGQAAGMLLRSCPGWRLGY